MVTPQQCNKKYGAPEKENNMAVWQAPSTIREAIPQIPARIYCNKDMVQPLEKALQNIINRGYTKEFKTWDGCFCIRKMRELESQSLHSWGIAIDINAATNQLNQIPTLSSGFVKCFTDAGFDWGGTWTRKDGMHFQLTKI